MLSVHAHNVTYHAGKGRQQVSAKYFHIYSAIALISDALQDQMWCAGYVLYRALVKLMGSKYVFEVTCGRL